MDLSPIPDGRTQEQGRKGDTIRFAFVSGRRSSARLWLLAFIGFWLMFAAWTFATPYNGPPDESQHTIRAAGVARGEIVAPQDITGGYQNAPKSIFPGWCFETNVNIAADCERQPGGDETVDQLHTTAARYNPVYYAVTGWPMGIWADWHGILLSRLLNGAAMAALLGCAVVAGARWVRHRALVAGVVVAVTPMVAHLGGAMNPQGIEIAAGVSLFAGLIALVHEQREGINRAAVALAGVSGAVIVTPRFTGVMWLFVILAAVLLPSRKARLKELFKSSTVRWWSLVVAVAVVAGAAWTLLVRAADPSGWDHQMTLGQIVKAEVLDIWPNVANQLVGVMGWAETLMPRLVYMVWFLAAGLLILGGFALGQRSDRFRLVLLFLATFVPLTALEILSANRIGFFNQGRYFLAGAVGLPMFGAYILSKRGFTGEQMRSTTRLLAVLVVPLQFVCLVYTFDRWRSGLVSLNPFNGSWHPPYGVVFPLLLGVLGTVGMLVTYWVASRVPAEPLHTPEEEPTMRIPAEPVAAGHV